MKIGILTDSTCDLSNDIIKRHKIEIAPLNIQFGDNVFIDGVDMSSADFFNKLTETDQIPGTSCPSIGLFIEKYKKMAQKYDAILSIHVSSGLSGTLGTAKMAANQLPDLNIHFIDSSSISLGLGFQVLLAARLIAEGFSLEDIINTVEQAKKKLLLYFTVGELTYMEKGGRIGKASAFLGSIFNINPIISISTETGKVLPLTKSRGKMRTMKKMVEIARNKLLNERYAWMGFAHGNRSIDLENFKENLLEKIVTNRKLKYETFNTRISPTLGVHVGPTVYAVIILTGDFLNI